VITPSDPLARVQRATVVKRRADHRAALAASEYATAIVNAYRSGVPYADLAAIVGTSRQNVRQLVERHT
jgi:DNA-directed RNA polymerase specialized sigma24 family protein